MIFDDWDRGCRKITLPTTQRRKRRSSPRLTREETGHKVLTHVEYRTVSGVLQNIDSPTPCPPSECVLPPHHKAGRGGGGSHSPGGEGDGGLIFWKKPDIELASYSIIPLRDRLSTPLTKVSVFLKRSFKGNVHRGFCQKKFQGWFFIKYVVARRYFPKRCIASISSNHCRIYKTHFPVTEGCHRVEQSPLPLSMALILILVMHNTLLSVQSWNFSTINWG